MINDTLVLNALHAWRKVVDAGKRMNEIQGKWKELVDTGRDAQKLKGDAIQEIQSCSKELGDAMTALDNSVREQEGK